MRKRKAASASPEDSSPVYESDAGNTVHEKDPGGDKRLSLGRFKSELSGSQVGHELEDPLSSTPRAELDGGDYMNDHRPF